MRRQAEQLLGARVTGSDGTVVGTVEQVFRDDVDGTPAWARVRSGKTGRFVPLGTSQVTADGLTVPFDSHKIAGSPDIDAGQHMSAGQAEQLSRHYGLIVPQQADQEAPGRQIPSQQIPSQQVPSQQVPARQGTGTQADQDWLVRQEERLQVGKEMFESGRVRLHKYVDVEPVEQAVHTFHEEYDIERIPVTAEDQVSGSIGEDEREVILHEERAVLRKEVVPVERVRLRTRRVADDSTVRDELRRERIEIEPEQPGPGTQR